MLPAAAATFIAEDQLRCAVPAAAASPGSLAVGVSVDGGAAWSAAGGAAASFTVYRRDAPPELSEVRPNVVDVSGGAATLVLLGTNLAPAAGLRCRLSETASGRLLRELPATFINASAASCDLIAPTVLSLSTLSIALAAGAAADGPTSAARPLTLYDSSRPPIVLDVHPTFAPLAAAAATPPPPPERRRSPSAWATWRRRGRSTASSAPSARRSLPSPTAVTLAAPAPAAHDTGSVPLTLARDAAAGDEPSAALQFTMVDPTRPPVVFEVRPRATRLAAGARVTISGENFAPSGDALRCRFGDDEVRASFASGDAVVCAVPAAASPHEVEVEVSVDGGARGARLGALCVV